MPWSEVEGDAETTGLTVPLLFFHQDEKIEFYTPTEQRQCDLCFTILGGRFHVLFGGLIMFWT